MRTKPLLLSILAPTLILPLCSGCFIYKPADPAPAWPNVPEPPGIMFDPADGVTPAGQPGAGIPLNTAGSPALPDAFRAEVVTPTQLILQGVKTVGGKPQLSTPDTSNPVRLAGIVAPGSGQTGFEEAKRTVTAWTQSQDLDVQADSHFPTDRNEVRQVLVLFKGRPSGDPAKKNPYEGKQFCLNRMLVRAGYAIVDLNSPTSFDQKQWLYDESYARLRHLGLWAVPAVFHTLQQRLSDQEVRKNTPKASSVTVTSAALGAPAAGAAGAPPGMSSGSLSAPGSAPGGPPSGAPAGLPAPGAPGGPPVR